LNAVPEQPSSPDVDAQWLRHLFTWVQQPSHTPPLHGTDWPAPTRRLQSKGGGGGFGGNGGDGKGGGGGGGDGERGQCDGSLPYRLTPGLLLQCSPIQWHFGKGCELNAVPEQPASPDVETLWLLHLYTWVQQPSHTAPLEWPLPSGTIRLQSKGGGDGGCGIGNEGGGSGGNGGGGEHVCDAQRLHQSVHPS
jgi:hypothetical protein